VVVPIDEDSLGTAVKASVRLMAAETVMGLRRGTFWPLVTMAARNSASRV